MSALTFFIYWYSSMRRSANKWLIGGLGGIMFWFNHAHQKQSTSILSSVNKWLLQWIEIANALISKGCSSKTDSKCGNGIDVSFRRILTRRTHYRHQKENFRNFCCVVPFYESVLIHGLISMCRERFWIKHYFYFYFGILI